MDPLSEYERVSRQVCLAEIGAAGQARIAAATLRTASGSELERLYLERAGVGCVQERTATDAPDFRHAAAFAFPHATQLGAAAWHALMALRVTLRVGE